jgi:hypothetical protein
MPMTSEFDPKKSYLAMKAHEDMIAFIGFQCSWGSGKAKEGVVKISQSARAYGRGSFTLTFIVDTAGEDELRGRLHNAVQGLSKADFQSFLGNGLDQITTVSLDSLAEMDDWYIEEVNIHLHAFEDRLSVLIEERLLPALDRALDFKFDSVQWWPQGRTVTPPSTHEMETDRSPKSLFQRWFGAR